MHEGAIEISTPDFLCLTDSSRAWISSSISRFRNRCFFSSTSLIFATFQSNSKLHRIHESAFQWSGLRTMEVPISVKGVSRCCFCQCKSLRFESNLKCQRIEDYAFVQSDSKAIGAPASVDVLDTSCFSNCTSLASLAFESNLQLHRIEKSAFAGRGLTQLWLPNSIHFVSGSAFTNVSLDAISFWPSWCGLPVLKCSLKISLVDV
jgi:hypothetical protein